MKILSLDASISSTGYSVVDKTTKDVIECGKITTKPKNLDSQRFLQICNKCEEIIIKHNIYEVVIEGQYVHKNKKTALKLASLLGALIVKFRKLGCEIYKIQPSQVRSLLLHGDSSKEEMANFIINFYPDNPLVKALGVFNDRNCKAKNSDIYDAISIALAYLTGLDNDENFQQM